MPEQPGTVTVLPVRGLPEVGTGDDLAALVVHACRATGMGLEAGDVVVVSSKVVSKALGLWATDRPAAVEDSTVRVVAERTAADGVVTRVVEAVAGPVMAAGGVDASNTGGREEVLLLPADPDAAAAQLLDRLLALTGLPDGALGVVVSDTAGRPWRAGQVDLALGAAGVAVADDLRGGVDADGRALAVTTRALADELASAADLVKGKTYAVPAAVVRGLSSLLVADGVGARSLLRSGPGDWFRLGHVEAVRAALGVQPGSADSVAAGLPVLGGEPVLDRVKRAVRVARHGLDDTGVDVTAPDPSGSSAASPGSSRTPDPLVPTPSGPSGSAPRPSPVPAGATRTPDTPATSSGPSTRVAELTLTAPDAYGLGVLAARLEVALWAEDLGTEPPVRHGHTATVVVHAG